MGVGKVLSMFGIFFVVCRSLF